MTTDDNTTVRRAFADTSIGQLHYRYAGQGPALLLLHASPGSSKQLEGLIAMLAGSFRVIAPDTPGNGDSPPLPLEKPVIADYSRLMLELMDALQIDAATVYGSHTGACLASEMALLAPERIERVVQDGAVVFSTEERAEMLEHYAHPFEPDLEGTHFLRAFIFCRDQFVFFPWYARDKDHVRSTGFPDARSLHDWVMEVLKGATSYHLAYRAAFGYPAEERLPMVKQPILCMSAADDPLGPGTHALADRIANASFQALPRYDAKDYPERLAEAIAAFATMRS